MDLVLSIVLLIGICVVKILQKPTSIIRASVTDEEGMVAGTVINEFNLVVGKNLMLHREPRAYHKILDEMGLS